MRNEPFVDEELGVFGETQIEFALSFHVVYGLHCFVDLVVQVLDLHLGVGGQQEAVHLDLECVVHLHVDVVARGLLLIGGLAFHSNQVIDNLKKKSFARIIFARNNCVLCIVNSNRWRLARILNIA